ncbi:MAG: DNA-protecting protein DprA [Blastocatellia bacterium]|nr:MAG: DNA-protecting protein DprA [Blastocatellia bacterium]
MSNPAENPPISFARERPSCDRRHQWTDHDRLDLVALSLLPVSLWRGIGTSLRQGQAPAEVLTRLLAERWPLQPGKRSELVGRAARALARGAASALNPILWSDEDYPATLAAIIDPPPVLWTRGTRAALVQPAVAIVGSRAASPYAVEVANQLAAALAGCGVAIVSGLARGVDSAAHRGAVSACGATIAVLGCGADMVYPREHASLARDIEANGLLMSELAPGTKPLPQFFPQRNRVISGLSRAVVIVEAGERSGSLITARCALEQGRDVLAVPGNILSGRNRGGHALLRDGAKIVESADDILEELGMRGTAATGPIARSGAAGTGGWPERLLACFEPGEACDLDEISERSGLSPARLLPGLFELELQGRIRRAGAGRFVRFDRSC